jgi:hypothetical protein
MKTYAMTGHFFSEMSSHSMQSDPFESAVSRFARGP